MRLLTVAFLLMGLASPAKEFIEIQEFSLQGCFSDHPKYSILDGQRIIPGGNWTFVLKLGSPTPTALLDGSSSFDEVMANAFARWNRDVGTVQFSSFTGTTGAGIFGNGINEVFFSDTRWGSEWGDTTVASARYSYRVVAGIRVTAETDIIFNSAYQWNSYRGQTRYEENGDWIPEMMRVALHEVGHCLGLGHPDENGQTVQAIMNSHASSIDDLTTDDLDGAQSLYPSVAKILTCLDGLAQPSVWWSGDRVKDEQGTLHPVLDGAILENGLAGRAFSLNGSDSVVKAEALALTAADNWTVAAWVFWNGQTGPDIKEKQVLFYNGNEGVNGFGLIVPEGGLCSAEPTLCNHIGSLVVLFGGAAYVPTGVYLDRHSWNHIAFTRQNGTTRLYKNGVECFSTTRSLNAPQEANGYTTIGSLPQYSFNGLVDELMFFRTSFTAEQVKKLHSSSFGTCKPLKLGFPKNSLLPISGMAGKFISIFQSEDLVNWRNPHTFTIGFDETFVAIDQDVPWRFFKVVAE